MKRQLTRCVALMRAAAISIGLLVLIAGCDYFISAESRYQRAQEFVAKGEHRRALIELKNALKKEPDLQVARVLLADVALWLGDPASADRELHLAAPDQDPVRYADLELRIHLALGRNQAALDRLTAGTPLIPPAKQSYYRGAALTGLNDTAEAERAFRAAVEADPSLIEAKVALADSLAARNELRDATDLAADIVEDHPDAALAWQARGTLLARSGENNAALQALRRAHALQTQLEFVRKIALLAALTDVLLAEPDVDAARTSSAELAKLAPGSPIALITSSRVLMATNDYVAAAADLRRVVNSNPRLSQARFLLGVTLFAQGNLEQASQELGAVVEQMPEHIEARQLLAQVRMRQEDPDGALRVLVPALQSGQDDARLASLMDAVRAKSGGSGQTVALLEQALKAAPDNHALQLQLASAYLQAGQAQRALSLLRRSQAAGTTVTQREALLLKAITDAQGPAAARAEVDAMIASNPNDVNLISLASAFYAHIGDVPAGRRLLVGAVQRQPENTALLFTLAQLELSNRRPAEARTALQRLLEIDATHSTARLTLAQLELASGRVVEAKSELELLRKNEPRAPLPRLLLARIALLSDNAAEAEALIEEAVGLAPGRAEMHNAAGMLYLDNGRYDKALAHFKQGTEIDPGVELMWLNLGRAQQALGQDGAARESFFRALKIKSGWLPAEGALAFLDLQAGERSAALERIARLKNEHPHNAGVLILAGDVHGTVRDYREAAQAFEAAAEIQPSGQLAYKAYEARRMAQLPKPAEPIRRWVDKNPDDLIYRSLLADAYTLSGERQQAVEQYERIVSAQPAHVASLNNLAWLYFELNDRRAVELARKAYALAPNTPAVADTLGWILVESGQVEEGLPILQRAAGSGGDPDIRYHYAVALARSGSSGAARLELQKVLQAHPEFPGRAAAQQLYERLEAGGGTGS